MPEVMTRLGPKLLAELDDIATTMEVTRAETIRQVLRLGLDAIYETADEEEDEDEDEEEDEETETCDECKAEIPSDAKFCPECGIEFEEEDEEDSDDEEEESEDEPEKSKED